MLIALLIIARTAHIGASILLAGTFIFELVTLGPARRPASGDLHEVEQHLLRLAGWSLIAALLSALLWFWLEVANMRGLPLVRVFSTTAWQTVLFETEFGRVWQLRIALIAVSVCGRRVRLRATSMATRADVGSLFGQWRFAHLARLDQPRCSGRSATAWFVRRCAPSLRRGRLDRRTPTAGNFLNARPCIVLVRRMRSFCTPALFHAQPELRGRPYRERHFQLLVVGRFDSRAFHDALWLALAC